MIATADVHDIRPPPGVDVVLLDSIKLVLKIIPSTGLDDGIKKRKEKASQGETVPFLDPCLAASIDEADAEMLLGLGHRGPHVRDDSVTVCGFKEYLSKPSATDFKPLFGKGSFLPFSQQTSKTIKRSRTSSITSLTNPDPRLLVRLVDASLRLALGGNYVVQRGYLISNAPGIKIHHYRFGRGLADFAPALFRPGYLPVKPPVSAYPFRSSSSFDLVIENLLVSYSDSFPYMTFDAKHSTGNRPPQSFYPFNCLILYFYSFPK